MLGSIIIHKVIVEIVERQQPLTLLRKLLQELRNQFSPSFCSLSKELKRNNEWKSMDRSQYN